MRRNHHRLLVEYRRLLNENRALRCLLHFRNDSELALLLSRADQNNSFEDVLSVIAWALERQLLVSKVSRLEAAERPHCESPIPF